MDIEYQIGIPESNRSAAARLYDQAFGRKLQVAIPDHQRRIAVFEAGMDLSKGAAALRGEDLVGIAGFHDDTGSLTGKVTFAVLRAELGVLGALRAVAILALLDRKPDEGELLMDGIVVDAAARGSGIGTALFSVLEDYCLAAGFSSIRLDVIDTNPGARRLYERLGFEATRTERAPVIGKRMGFASSTTMVKRLD